MKNWLGVAVMCTVGCSAVSPSAPSGVTATSQTQQIGIGTFVPGTASLWLAGMPDGTIADAQTVGGVSVDSAPAQSPPYVTLDIGKVYTYEVGFGCVRNGPELPCYDANGQVEYLIHHLAGPENGVLSLTAPVNSLIGLFQGENQPFLLGKGGELTARTSRLYLGTQDGWEWNNNSGQFAVKFYEK